MANGPAAMEHFYSHLFTASPEMRAMFPMDMSQVREHVFTALARLIWTIDAPEDSAAYLAQLGRDHRKYGVKEKHYLSFFTTLMDTVAWFSGPDWTPETAQSWRKAVRYAARMMRMAADDDARNHPPWWVGEITAHEQRGESVAVLTIAPDRPLPYWPGQYLRVQVTRWPRVWRCYSVAGAPRGDNALTLHVRAIPGGMVSTALVRHVVPGDTVLLGPAAGTMTVPDNDRDLLCVAGGTGLAPVKAIIEDAARRRRDRKVTLFAGARTQRDLYDLPGLARLQADCPALEIVAVIADPAPLTQPAGDCPRLSWYRGLLPDVVRACGLFENSEAFISGPPAMVAQTAALLAAHVPAAQIHHDPLPGAIL